MIRDSIASGALSLTSNAERLISESARSCSVVKTHHNPKCAYARSKQVTKKPEAVRFELLYGDTVIVAVLLTTLPTEAVIVTVPPEPVARPGTIETVPADTVAMAVLLEFQVATLVTSTIPLQVVAFASIVTVGSLVVIVPLVGSKAIDAIHPTVTVRPWVADTAGF